MGDAKNRVLLVGGAGRTGRLVAAVLHQRGWNVRALVRDAETARAVLPPGTEYFTGAVWAGDAVAAAATGVNTVIFMASGSMAADSSPREVDFEGVAAAAGAATRAAARHFILLSSAGVTQPEHPHNSTFRNVLKWKQRGEASLRSHSISHSIVRALGLRDRESGRQGVRLLQGDRIAYGEDIARGDVAELLADVACIGIGNIPASAVAAGAGFAPETVMNATFEIYNDGRIPGGEWRCARQALVSDVKPL